MKLQRTIATLMMAAGVALVAHAEDFAAEISTAAHHEGFLDVYTDPSKGRILLALPGTEDGATVARFMYQVHLRRGLGSNPVGLDRTLGGSTYVVAAERRANKVIFEVENWSYQARDGSPGEKKAVDESFARSVMWAGEILAEDSGQILFDATSLLTSDAMNLAARLAGDEQGAFKRDEARSYPLLDATLAFPDNVELEAVLTLTGSDPGAEIVATTPLPESISLIMHHTFARLPDDGYQPLPYDPRTGGIEHLFYDFATPLAEPITTRYAWRHRLQKDANGNIVKPIVFYLDRGVPEPVRSALLDGARWWEDAFAAAGFPGGYRVELLPEDAHPLDIRYNVITWVHRATRGWSYGASVVDPRTGEIIKGYVLLGSQRVRQDRIIFEGLAGTEKTGSGANDDPIELALARIRQLSAHEVGHTIGLQHNFAASTYDRGSVMDYPAPYVRPDGEGGLDFSEAYATGAGPWDRFAIHWLYGDLDTDERANLIVNAYQDGLRFVTDVDGRGAGTAHHLGAIWDNGADPVATLTETLRVREIALANFGPDRIAPGRPMSDLHRVLVPIYFYHRYQLAAAAKSIGGVDYTYRLRGDGRPGVSPVPADRQWAALDAMLAALTPAQLDLADEILDELTPRSRGFYGDPIVERELVAGHTDPLFDPLAAADQAAALTLSIVLNPARTARLVDQHRRNPDLPGLEGVLARIEDAILTAPRRESSRHRTLRAVVERAYARQLMGLAADDGTSPLASAVVEHRLRTLADRLGDDAHAIQLTAEVTRYLDRGLTIPFASPPVAAPPPGSPIGAGFAESCWHCN